MKRSQINQRIATAAAFMREHGWHLPAWASWSASDFVANPGLAAYLYAHQMGWDVTDFGHGRFEQRGLVLFCLRNGVAGRFDEKPYAEKLMMVLEDQETPLHYHQAKMEDIINRAGGTLILEFYATDAQGKATQEAVVVRRDGEPCLLRAGEPLRLQPGQSVTVTQRTLHRFYAEQGGGPVLAGEVSQCNDDFADNFFAEAMGRFSAIDEDEAVQTPLWNEVNLQ